MPADPEKKALDYGDAAVEGPSERALSYGDRAIAQLGSGVNAPGGLGAGGQPQQPIRAEVVVERLFAELGQSFLATLGKFIPPGKRSGDSRHGYRPVKFEIIPASKFEAAMDRQLRMDVDWYYDRMRHVDEQLIQNIARGYGMFYPNAPPAVSDMKPNDVARVKGIILSNLIAGNLGPGVTVGMFDRRTETIFLNEEFVETDETTVLYKDMVATLAHEMCHYYACIEWYMITFFALRRNGGYTLNEGVTSHFAKLVTNHWSRTRRLVPPGKTYVDDQVMMDRTRTFFKEIDNWRQIAEAYFDGYIELVFRELEVPESADKPKVTKYELVVGKARRNWAWPWDN